ncbi:hypothetical protein NMG60_11019658 [Bertholletia excelsa]
MSSSLEPLLPPPPPPPPPEAIQQAYTARSGHGSIGPFIAVLAVISILGAVAVMIGRLCSGRRIMGYGQFDVEGWIENKCASCIDGRVEPPAPSLPQRPAAESTSSSPRATDVAEVTEPAPAPADSRGEAKKEAITRQGPSESTGS